MSPADEFALHEALDPVGLPASMTLVEQVRALVAENLRLQTELAARAVEPDRERLLKALDEDRFGVLLALADLCLDEGRDGEAKGWGWLANSRKWPWLFKGRWWWVPNGSPAGRNDVLLLPLDVANGLPSSGFASPRPALEWVVGRIAEGEWWPG